MGSIVAFPHPAGQSGLAGTPALRPGGMPGSASAFDGSCLATWRSRLISCVRSPPVNHVNPNMIGGRTAPVLPRMNGSAGGRRR